MATKPDYTRKCQQLDVLIDLLERENKRLREEKEKNKLPPAEPKTGKWILDRSGAYCCSECMEPCASYVMMKPRDKFCKMCGSRNEATT